MDQFEDYLFRNVRAERVKFGTETEFGREKEPLIRHSGRRWRGMTLPPWSYILAHLSVSARDLDDFYFPLTEGKLEKANEVEEENEMEVEFEEIGKLKLKMEEDEVEDALAPGLEPATPEVGVECANHKTTPPQTN